MRILFFLCLVSVSAVFSQEKIEREYRIKSTEAPKKSQQIIKKWNFKKKVKWYVEESQDGKTFEAKVKHKSKKHSIEFTENGDLMDVEVMVRFKKLPKKIKKNIKKSLAKRFRKFKIEKTQIQYKGKEDDVYKEIFKLKTNRKKLEPLYELVIKGKTTGRYKLYELLLNKKGKILKELKFAEQNSDHLEF